MVLLQPLFTDVGLTATRLGLYCDQLVATATSWALPQPDLGLTATVWENMVLLQPAGCSVVLCCFSVVCLLLFCCVSVVCLLFFCCCSVVVMLCVCCFSVVFVLCFCCSSIVFLLLFCGCAVVVLFFVAIQHWECLGTLNFENCCTTH